MIVHVDTTKPVILVDGSYYVFYRYFATLRWYAFQHPDRTLDATVACEDAFRAALVKHLDADIAKLHKTWHKPPGTRKRVDVPWGQNVVVCADCSRDDIWRRDVFPEYKQGRATPAHFHGDAFALLYDHMRSRGIPIVEGARLEADDVVHALRQRLREVCEGGTCTTCVVITNDNDYLQMLDDTTHVFNMQGKELRGRSCGDAGKDLVRKILLGDKSDMIPPVCPKLGQKTAERWSDLTEHEREAAIEAEVGQGALHTYRRNKQLMCMQQVPQNLVGAMLSGVEFHAHAML